MKTKTLRSLLQPKLPPLTYSQVQAVQKELRARRKRQRQNRKVGRNAGS